MVPNSESGTEFYTKVILGANQFSPRKVLNASKTKQSQKLFVSITEPMKNGKPKAHPATKTIELPIGVFYDSLSPRMPPKRLDSTPPIKVMAPYNKPN